MFKGLQERLSVRVLAAKKVNSLLRLPELPVAPLQQTDADFVTGQAFLECRVPALEESQDLLEFGQRIFERWAFGGIWRRWCHGHFRETKSSVTVRFDFGRFDPANDAAMLDHGYEAIAGLNLSGGTEERRRRFRTGQAIPPRQHIQG